MDEVSLLHLGALATVGLVAGVLNTLAGGGSLLTLPALVFLGLPAADANGTNRVAVVVQSLVAARRFRARGLLPLGSVWGVLPVTVLGALVGAWASLQLDETGLRRAMAVVMVAIVGLLWLRPEQWAAGRGRRLPAWAVQLAFAFVGFYGGFIQAGVGVLLLLALSAGRGLDLVRANGAKVALVLLFTLPALALFWSRGAVQWLPGLVLSLGTAAGAEVGARLAVAKGAPVIRVAVTVAVVGAALRLFAS